MTDDEKLLKKRFRELHDRAEQRGITVYSDFLSMAEQDALLSLGLLPPPELYGGYPGAERRLARFGAVDGRFPCPAVCLLVSPRSARFAEKLTHRDFLGALMSLGVRRETLGDIVVTDMGAYVFCLETVAGFLCDNLDEVRRTPVRCERTAVPESLLAAEPEERELVVASPRADALVAAVYRLSRSEAQALFVRGLVFVNARLLENGSRELNDGDIVSVRGYGRFVFGGMLRETKKGRIRASVLIY